MIQLPSNNCENFGAFFVYATKEHQYFIDVRGVNICISVKDNILSAKFIDKEIKGTLLDLACPTESNADKALFELSQTQGLNIALGSSLVSITSNEDGLSCDLWSDVNADDCSTATGYVLTEDFALLPA